MKKTLFALMLSALCLPAFIPAYAEDSAAPAATQEDTAKPETTKAEEGVNLKAADDFKEKAEDLKADLAAKLEALRKRLDEKQNRHFGIIYNNHNLIETVKTVQGDVGKAVEACSGKNPDLADKMKSRFDDWKTAVNAKMKEAEDLTNSMILAQDYASKEEMAETLKASDLMRTHSQTIYEKVPVTSHEACEYLYEKMQETKDNMVSMLGTTLISVPQEMQKADEERPDDKKPEESKSEPEKEAEKPADETPAGDAQ
ncbi:MAG: hypothetical protein LRY54_03655 [Alphaproteobacteria bacterium]|nr:hypothetical protein [Alphaproteobacteria bacterium]